MMRRVKPQGSRPIFVEREWRAGYRAGYRAALTEACSLMEHKGLGPSEALETCYEHQRKALREWTIDHCDRRVPAPSPEETGW